MNIMIPVSFGELIDKITILKIKYEKFEGRAQQNVKHELLLLQKVRSEVMLDNKTAIELGKLSRELRQINGLLWHVEEVRRLPGQSDAAIVSHAQAVSRFNEERARLKREITLLVGTPGGVIEEKNYGIGA